MTISRRRFTRSLPGASLALAGLTLGGCGTALDESGRLLTADGGEQEKEDDFVTLYDTHAMALYFDGGLGPRTGIIPVSAILANEPFPLVFWHGHGGTNHAFTVLPEHFDQLVALRRVYLETTAVDRHVHRLFIDPTDSRYRVAGAPPVRVPKRP